MQLIDVSRRTIGINLVEGKAVANIWAPFAEKVAVVVGDKDIELTRQEYGYWQSIADKITAGTKYKVRIDNHLPLPDPCSLSQPDGVHSESEVIDLSHFQWSTATWNNLPLEDYIIYELHVGTFSEQGTFASLEEKLDHLNELGINAIEIMPVAQFPGKRNWGYDGVFPFAVQNSYGGPAGLQRLVDACHQRGLAVILDVVYNHLGPEGNYLGEFGPYFTNKYNTPWGGAINFDDQWCDGVRRYFIENALMWFRDFRIDALRLDAVHAIKDFSPVHILKEIKIHVEELMRVTGRRHYLIVELDLNDPKFIAPAERGGLGMDAQWIDEFHHALRVTAGQEKSGYYADFSGIEHLAKAYKDAYVYDGQWSPHRNKFFGVKADEAEGKQFIVFSQNHDQVGNRMLGERTGELVSFEMQKLMAGAVLISPFLPLLFMGEEWSEPHPFQYFVSHTNEELAEAVRKGRKEEFKAFHAAGEAPDPMAEETFNNSKLQWNLVTRGKHRTMLQYYQALIAYRNQIPALKNLNRKNVTVDCMAEKNMIAIHRWHENSHALCLLNFSKGEETFNSDKALHWQLGFNSAAKEWGGSGRFNMEMKRITIQPESFVILTSLNA
jgi:maltooligosyltrehalose trehalohydrolase